MPSPLIVHAAQKEKKERPEKAQKEQERRGSGQHHGTLHGPHDTNKRKRTRKRKRRRRNKGRRPSKEYTTIAAYESDRRAGPRGLPMR